MSQNIIIIFHIFIAVRFQCLMNKLIWNSGQLNKSNNHCTQNDGKKLFIASSSSSVQYKINYNNIRPFEVRNGYVQLHPPLNFQGSYGIKFSSNATPKFLIVLPEIYTHRERQ